jgi:cytoskeletal protein CcmA (bactofilin family)
VWRKEDLKTQGVPELSTTTAGDSRSTPIGTTSSELPVSLGAAACISRGIRIKGEVIGKEDLFIDGQVDGKLDLSGASLTIGPNGRIKADISARELIVRGHVNGKVSARERVQLWNTGHVEGEVQTDRLAIEDGAFLRGKVEAGKPLNKPKEAQATPAAAHGTAASATAAASSGKAAI